jgi:hypothetical protein
MDCFWKKINDKKLDCFIFIFIIIRLSYLEIVAPIVYFLVEAANFK